MWEHDGVYQSFTAELFMLPEQGFAVAICASGAGGTLWHSLDVAVTTLADLPEPTTPPQYTFDPTKLDDHVGTYSEPWGLVGDMVITRNGDTLEIELPWMTDNGYEVTPHLLTVSSDLFVLQMDGGNYDLTFFGPDGGGPSEYVRNRGFVTTRVAETARAAAAPHRRLSRAEVERRLREARLSPRELRRLLAMRAPDADRNDGR